MVVMVDIEEEMVAGRDCEGTVATPWGRSNTVEEGKVGETSRSGVVVVDEDLWSARVA